ncbi:MAG: capsular biosynthesis protein [Pseudomonadota bacterium]
MIVEDRVLVVDIDGTLCPEKPTGVDYADLPVEPRMRDRLNDLRAQGWHIVLHTARGMRSNGGNVGAVAARVLPTLIAWLDRHGVGYDEIVIAKPWAGRCGYYIDDRAVRPREFLDCSLGELDDRIRADRVASPHMLGRDTSAAGDD